MSAITSSIRITGCRGAAEVEAFDPVAVYLVDQDLGGARGPAEVSAWMIARVLKKARS